MRIGHYMSGILDPGGVATYIHRISLAQQGQGHTVCYLDNRHTDPAARGDRLQPVVVRDDAGLFAKAVALELDVLHLHLGVGCLPPQGLPVVRTVHGHHPYCPSGARYLQRSDRACERSYDLRGCLSGHLLERCGSIRPADLYRSFRHTWDELRVLPHIPAVAVSAFVKEQMIRTGYAERDVQVLYLPAPEGVPYQDPEAQGVPRFVFMGRIVPQKGLDWLVQALSRVTVPVHLDVAGRGYQEAQIRKQVERFGLGQRVTFHGWLGESEVLDLIRRSRAVIFPSVWHEPAGLVTIEAGALGRPVIASRVGGIPEYVVPGRTALLVEPSDVTGLAGTIERLATDWPLARRMGEEAWKLTKERFSLSSHRADLERLYQRAVNNRRFEPDHELS